MLEIETFIPMQMQSTEAMDGCRLKRVVLIGDHHQLPPIVQNMAFKILPFRSEHVFPPDSLGCSSRAGSTGQS